jgi:hypothetical protein
MLIDIPRLIFDKPMVIKQCASREVKLGALAAGSIL